MPALRSPQHFAQRFHSVPLTVKSEDLLAVCLQDLADGYRQISDRMGALVEASQSLQLRSALSAVESGAAVRLRRLKALDYSLDGAENLWMAGIVADACRDIRTIATGHLLDIALIGAVRKALAAEEVSTETALVVADRLSKRDVVDTLRRNAEQLSSEDSRLQRLLVERTAV